MGNLAHFDLTDLAGRYGLKTFVETGTGAGDSLYHAASLRIFDFLRSCEINPELADRAYWRFSSLTHIGVYKMSSARFLAAMLPALTPDPVLFWLDAHFPGADYGLASYDDPDVLNADRLPLAQELYTIRALRPHCAADDVILIDDARIWLDSVGTESFKNGPLPDHLRSVCPTARSIEFINEAFFATHNVAVSPDDEGYIVLTPRPLLETEHG